MGGIYSTNVASFYLNSSIQNGLRYGGGMGAITSAVGGAIHATNGVDGLGGGGAGNTYFSGAPTTTAFRGGSGRVIVRLRT